VYHILKASLALFGQSAARELILERILMCQAKSANFVDLADITEKHHRSPSVTYSDDCLLSFIPLNSIVDKLGDSSLSPNREGNLGKLASRDFPETSLKCGTSR
jgi:hypothetical protein